MLTVDEEDRIKWKPKSNKVTSKVVNTFPGKSHYHHLGLSHTPSAVMAKRRNSNSYPASSSSMKTHQQHPSASIDSSDGSSSPDTTDATTPTSPSSSKSSSLFDLSVFGKKSQSPRRRGFPSSSSQTATAPHHRQQNGDASQKVMSPLDLHLQQPMPYVDMPLQFNFGSTYASSLTIFFDN